MWCSYSGSFKCHELWKLYLIKSCYMQVCSLRLHLSQRHCYIWVEQETEMVGLCVWKLHHSQALHLDLYGTQAMCYLLSPRLALKLVSGSHIRVSLLNYICICKTDFLLLSLTEQSYHWHFKTRKLVKNSLTNVLTGFQFLVQHLVDLSKNNACLRKSWQNSFFECRMSYADSCEHYIAMTA